MEAGMTAITTIMDFVTSNSTFSILIGLAIAGAAISMVMGIFYRR